MKSRQAPVAGVRGYLLLLSHMRGYTTLLGHILGSHPDITGYCEMHSPLRRQSELHRLAKAVAGRSRKGYRHRYVFDNLLHNRLEVSRRVLRRTDVWPLVMVREPIATIDSILRIGARFITTVTAAEEYYLQRLKRLQQLLRWCEGEVFFLQAEALVEQSDDTLRQLHQWLGLDEPLSSEYQCFQHTGKRRLGDSSKHIHAGRILSFDERGAARAPLFSPVVVGRSVEAHQSLLRWVRRELAADKTVFS